MAGKMVTLEEREGIARVTLNNPPVNVLTPALIQELDEIFRGLGENKAVAVIILTGAGEKAFSAGADINLLAGLDSRTGQDFFQDLHRTFRLIENCPQPVIGAINGFAIGAGFELMLSCDIRIAARETKVGPTGVNMGLSFNTQRLPRLVGLGKAKELVLTGSLIYTREAQQLGIIERVVPRGKLRQEADRLAALIKTRAPLAVQLAKKAINRSRDLPLEEGIGLELEYLARLFASADQKEAARAFIEKRTPRFEGK